jgi:hypothetical protein
MKQGAIAGIRRILQIVDISETNERQAVDKF